LGSKGDDSEDGIAVTECCWMLKKLKGVTDVRLGCPLAAERREPALSRARHISTDLTGSKIPIRFHFAGFNHGGPFRRAIGLALAYKVTDLKHRHAVGRDQSFASAASTSTSQLLSIDPHPTYGLLSSYPLGKVLVSRR
jgi:hypothetical protein